MYNAKGRGYPDVAANGHNFLVYQNSSGGWQVSGGTSAATPTWAGIIARLNGISLQKTRKPLGFLNPLLYTMSAKHPESFTDVTVGDNKCTELHCSSCCKGFTATKGWDAVSGLGVPNYAEMAMYLSVMLGSG